MFYSTTTTSSRIYYASLFLYILYIFQRFCRDSRLQGLKSIYLLRGHHIKSVADSSYSLPSGEGNFHSNVPPRRHSGKEQSPLLSVNAMLTEPTLLAHHGRNVRIYCSNFSSYCSISLTLRCGFFKSQDGSSYACEFITF